MGIDGANLRAVKNAEAKVELVYQWMQQSIVENIGTGVMAIPPPLLSRVFNEGANGMVQFHEALKISNIPFPFPYAQTCDILLLLHSLITPFLVSQWVSSPLWASIFSFIQVFVFWSLRYIALEIENPFGQDANDINASEMQTEFNVQLRMLISPEADQTPRCEAKRPRQSHRSSFYDLWSKLDTFNDKQGFRRSYRSTISNGTATLEPRCCGIHLPLFQKQLRHRSKQSQDSSSRGSVSSEESYQDTHVDHSRSSGRPDSTAIYGDKRERTPNANKVKASVSWGNIVVDSISMENPDEEVNIIVPRALAHSGNGALGGLVPVPASMSTRI